MSDTSKEKLEILRQNAMRKDVSWETSAKAYTDLIKSRLKPKRKTKQKH